MPTRLIRRVVRVTTGRYKDGGRERRIEIALLPGDTIRLRYLRTRGSYEVTIPWVMERAQILKSGVNTAPPRRRA